MWTPHALDIMKDCFSSQLSAEELFAALSQATQKEWMQLCRQQRFVSGSRLFCEGESPRGLYLLRSGQAQLCLGQSPEVSCFIRCACAHEVLGLTATIAGLPYDVTVEAVTRCEAYFVASDEFLAFLRAHGDVCYFVTQHLSRKLATVYRSV